MHVRAYLYNAGAPPDHVHAVLEALASRDGDPDLVDVAEGDDARRRAMLTLRESIRIGESPDAIYDDDGTPDFAPGVLVTEDETGRRHLHVGPEAMDALEDASDDR